MTNDRLFLSNEMVQYSILFILQMTFYDWFSPCFLHLAPNVTYSACAFSHSSAVCAPTYLFIVNCPFALWAGEVQGGVPDNITITSKPVGFCEEEWERQKKTYVESVKKTYERERSGKWLLHFTKPWFLFRSRCVICVCQTCKQKIPRVCRWSVKNNSFHVAELAMMPKQIKFR